MQGSFIESFILIAATLYWIMVMSLGTAGYYGQHFKSLSMLWGVGGAYVSHENIDLRVSDLLQQFYSYQFEGKLSFGGRG